MIEKILDGLLDNNGELSITLKTRSGLSRRDAREKQGKASLPPAKVVKITFPGVTVNEAWRFSVLLRILEIVHNSLVDNVVLSKRDLYYRDTELFVKQSVVDRYVDDLACTFGVPRSSLNVTAAAKGLVAGNFIILRADGNRVNGLSDNEGLLLPRVQDDDDLDVSNVQHIVIIEKEATFRSLLSSPSWDELKLQCLVMTAKGYPDLASRRFLRLLADHAPYIPMHIVVDFDPDGINIMSTYKHGSYRLAHEDGTDSGTPSINLPQLRWLGVQSHQLSRLPAMGLIPCDGATTGDQGLTRMTARDRRKACQMLEWDIVTEEGGEKIWRHELHTMLMLNIKAEMQVLEERSGGLASWLGAELREYESTLDPGRTDIRVRDASSDEVLDFL
ncbi:Spo11/DNA topoisomerase VI subunit A [Lophiotrema nucula]|uniref:DNA topoisomerase (ATP-hydrolyzing) n=1 Tax=Lophiotrema nucula TaxID=690887 RepID=A0A6A5YK91_9PLEO|nr:Spo11/DNA topoisomerase VI subunit A [Lophiotrema nucula]